MHLNKPIAVPKPRPAKLDRADRRALRKALDEVQNRIVRKRSGGQCEVFELDPLKRDGEPAWRCNFRASHIHHMLSGWGIRARGNSAKAEHKQHVCVEHHPEITGHVLQRIGGLVPLWTDTYLRVR